MCAYKLPPTTASSRARLSHPSVPSYLLTSLPPFPHAYLKPVLFYHPEKCRRRGAERLVLGHSEAASLGTARGGPCEGGRPRGRPGLSRAPARAPPISEEPLRSAGGWENSLLAVTDADVEGKWQQSGTTALLMGWVGEIPGRCRAGEGIAGVPSSVRHTNWVGWTDSDAY